MSQNSIFTKIQFYCTIHQKTKITHVCIDIQCPANPLLCNTCLNQYEIKNKHYFHQKSVKNCQQGLNQIANLVGNDKSIMERIYKSSIGKKENDLLIRSVEQKQRHYLSIERHINSIKYQVEEQMINMLKIFEKSLEQSKKIIFTELDDFYKTYAENIEIFSKLIDPLVIYNRNYKYYSNPNNIYLKLITEPKKKSIDWLSDLKNLLNFTQKINSSSKGFEENLEKALTSMNSMLNSIPMIDFQQQNIQKNILANLIESLRSSLKLNEIKNLNYILTENPYYQNESKKKKTIFGTEQKLVKRFSTR